MWESQRFISINQWKQVEEADCLTKRIINQLKDELTEIIKFDKINYNNKNNY